MDMYITIKKLQPRIVEGGYFTREAIAIFDKKRERVKLFAYKDSDFRLTSLINGTYSIKNGENISEPIRVKSLKTGKLICYI